MYASISSDSVGTDSFASTPLSSSWIRNFSTRMSRHRNDVVASLNDFRRSTDSAGTLSDRILKIYDRYLETMYGEDSLISIGGIQTPLYFHMEKFTNHYGQYSLSVDEWRSLIINLHDMGVRRILSVASGSAGMETLLYIFSKHFLDEPFEIIATDGHLTQTSPTRTNFSTSYGDTTLDCLPVQRRLASQAIEENQDVDAYFATMLPMDIHYENQDGECHGEITRECPGECIANAAVLHNRPMVVFGEYRDRCTGTKRFWDVVGDRMTEKSSIDFANQATGMYFHASIYVRNDQSDDDESDVHQSDDDESDVHQSDDNGPADGA